MSPSTSSHRARSGVALELAREAASRRLDGPEIFKVQEIAGYRRAGFGRPELRHSNTP